MAVGIAIATAPLRSAYGLQEHSKQSEEGRVCQWMKPHQQRRGATKGRGGSGWLGLMDKNSVELLLPQDPRCIRLPSRGPLAQKNSASQAMVLLHGSLAHPGVSDAAVSQKTVYLG